MRYSSGSTSSVRAVDDRMPPISTVASGALLGTSTTRSTGAYTLSVPFAGDVVVEVTDGTYVDEATSTSTTLATPMRVVVNANGGNVTGVVTPLTTLAYTYSLKATLIKLLFLTNSVRSIVSG